MPIHPKTFKSLLGPEPKIETRNGVKSTGKVHDGEGLYLIVGTGAQRSWLYRYQFNKSACELALGSAHKIDLGDARAKRAECETLLDKGIDPKAVRESERKAVAAAKVAVDTRSLHELLKDAAPSCGPPWNESQPVKSAKYQREWLLGLRPEKTDGLTAMQPRDITRDDVARALTAIRNRTKTGAQAARIQMQLHRLFEWCAANGHIPENASNPADFKGRWEHKLRPLPPRQISQATISWESMPGVVAKIRAHQDAADYFDSRVPHAERVATVRYDDFCLEWVLLSAVRVANGYEADWTEIDLNKLMWTIPAWKMKVKNVGPHYVPLTPRHLEILKAVMPEGFALKDGAAPKSGLIFKSVRGRALEQTQILARLRVAYPDLIVRNDGSVREASVHGLRGAFRTWGEEQLNEETGLRLYDDETLEGCLAHVVGNKAKRAYLHGVNIRARRTVLSAWADFLAKPYVVEVRADEAA